MPSGARPIAIPAAELAALALGSAHASAVSPLDGTVCLLIDLDDAGALRSATPDPGLIRWLGAQAGPVIGIGERAGVEALAAACDLVVDDHAALGSVLDNIARAPRAAMVLVQVLRLTEHMNAAQALTIESLAYSTLQSGPEFRRWSAAHPPQPQGIPGDDGAAVLVERGAATLELRLNRPSSRNAMSIEMRDALVEALELAVLDDSIAHIRLSALGACFSTGGALEEFGSADDPASAHAVRSLRLPAATLLRTRATMQVEVHGACIGSGIEFPAFAQRLVAHPGAFFQLPEIRFGLIPGAGGCVSLPRRIGRQRTAYLALSARRINAATALAWGLIDEITPAAQR